MPWATNITVLTEFELAKEILPFEIGFVTVGVEIVHLNEYSLVIL